MVCMKIVVTGSHGTIGSQLVKQLTAAGHTVLGWDRTQVPITDYWAMESWLKTQAPDALYHLASPSQPTGLENEGWLVNYQWTSELAWLCRELKIDFIYTSTVMVFSNQVPGPFTPDTRPDAYEGYGMEKRLAEERVFYQNPQAKVIRLGWQIGHQAGSNNMVDFIETRMKSDGLVPCSTHWLPACSYLDDTAEILVSLLALAPGLYQFDSNEKWSFYQIAFALNVVHGKRWKITATDNFVYDQRMTDPKLPLKSLKNHLKTLK